MLDKPGLMNHSNSTNETINILQNSTAPSELKPSTPSAGGKTSTVHSNVSVATNATLNQESDNSGMKVDVDASNA